MKGRDPLAVAAVLLAAVAFAGSFDHVRSVVDDHGQTGWLAWAIAAMPEVSVALAVLKVRRARTTGEATGWAWLVGTSAAAFTVSANLATAQPNPWGYVAAAWPAWASIGAFGLIEVGGRPPKGAETGSNLEPVSEPPSARKTRKVAEDISPVEPETALEAEVLAPALEAAPAPEHVRAATGELLVEALALMASGPPPVSAPLTAPEPRPLPVAAARQERPGAVTVRTDDGEDPLFLAAHRCANDLLRAGKRLTRDNLVNALRDARHTCSNAKASELLQRLRETA